MRGDVIPYKVIQVLFFVLLPSLLRLLQVDAFLLTVVSDILCLVIQIFQSKSHKYPNHQSKYHKYIPPIKASQISKPPVKVSQIYTTILQLYSIY